MQPYDGIKGLGVHSLSKIERGRGVSLWRQIAERLQHEIVAGTFKPGTQLPTEIELATDYEVNRHTVRRAIASLTENGFLTATRGRGTFVAQAPITYPISARTRFSEIISAQKRQPGGRLISSSEEVADEEVAKYLGLLAGDPVLRIDTLRVADGVPITVATNWFRQDLLPDLVPHYAELGSISKAMARAGFENYKRDKSWVTAIAATVHDARLLQVEVGFPLMQITSVNVSETGEKLQYTRSRFRGESVQLEIES